MACIVSPVQSRGIFIPLTLTLAGPSDPTGPRAARLISSKASICSQGTKRPCTPMMAVPSPTLPPLPVALLVATTKAVRSRAARSATASTQGMAGLTQWNGRAVVSMSGTSPEGKSRKTFWETRRSPHNGVSQQHHSREGQTATSISFSRINKLFSIPHSAVGTARTHDYGLC